MPHTILSPPEALCPLCSNEQEEISHLFLHCSFAHSLWGWWCRIWGLSWVWPSSLDSAFAQWSFPSKNKFLTKIWLAIFQVIVWSIWKERNDRIFNNTSNLVHETQNMVLLRLCWWVKNWKEPFPYSPIEVMRNPRCLRWQPSSNPTVRKSCEQTLRKVNKLIWEVDVSKTVTPYGMRIEGSMRDCNDVILCAFSCPIPLMEEVSAEVLAIHRALQISLNNNRFKKFPIEIKTKSQRVVEWCRKLSDGPTNL